MLKIKTKKSVSKRIVKITKKGKVMRRRITAQHLARRKSKRTRKNAGKKTTVNSANKRIINLTPYK